VVHHGVASEARGHLEAVTEQLEGARSALFVGVPQVHPGGVDSVNVQNAHSRLLQSLLPTTELLRREGMGSPPLVAEVNVGEAGIPKDPQVLVDRIPTASAGPGTIQNTGARASSRRASSRRAA